MFQSTLPTRGSDYQGRRNDERAACFNPRSPRGGATRNMIPKILIACVSIHAPHEGERRKVIFDNKTYSYVSIHAPHEGERRSSFIFSIIFFRFQSTLPPRGSDF